MLTNKEALPKLDGKGLVAVCSWCVKESRNPSGKWTDPRMFSFNYFGGQV